MLSLTQDLPIHKQGKKLTKVTRFAGLRVLLLLISPVLLVSMHKGRRKQLVPKGPAALDMLKTHVIALYKTGTPVWRNHADS